MKTSKQVQKVKKVKKIQREQEKKKRKKWKKTNFQKNFFKKYKIQKKTWQNAESKKKISNCPKSPNFFKLSKTLTNVPTVHSRQ